MQKFQKKGAKSKKVQREHNCAKLSFWVTCPFEIRLQFDSEQANA